LARPRALALACANDARSAVRDIRTRYRAPELLVENQDYTTAIDVWAVGCIFAEMIGRKALFPGRDYLHQLRLIIDVLGTPSEEDLASIANVQAVQFLRTLPVQPQDKKTRPSGTALCGPLLLACPPALSLGPLLPAVSANWEGPSRLHALAPRRPARPHLSIAQVKPKRPWSEVFPKASPQARHPPDLRSTRSDRARPLVRPRPHSQCLELLSSMLVFNPAKRCTMQDALQCEYMAPLHQSRPLPEPESSFSFEFEKPNVSQAALLG
jgi:serine/threonine protein kinase